MISSSSNPKIKLIRGLLSQRKVREKEKKFVAEGALLVQEAIQAPRTVEYVVYTKKLAETKAGKELVKKVAEARIENFEVSEKIFQEASETKTPQGIMGVIKQRPFDLEDLVSDEDPLIVFCSRVQDPGNLGTIIRTADTAGASGVITCRGTVDIYNPKVVRATMGGIFHLPIVSVNDTKKTLSNLKAKKVRIVATSSKAEKDYTNIDYKQGAVIVIGNEARGLPQDIIKMADEMVKIPLRGKAESLNAAVATAIVLYEAVRQRS